MRQSRKYLVWRLSHLYDSLVAARLIVWFDDERDTAVIALLAGDKAQLGDLFYSTVGTRADQIIDQWKAERGRNR